MNKKDTTKWMNTYHDKWTEAHNKLIDKQNIIENNVVGMRK